MEEEFERDLPEPEGNLAQCRKWFQAAGVPLSSALQIKILFCAIEHQLNLCGEMNLI